MKTLIATCLFIVSLQASSAVICTGCAYIDSSAGTYLGLQNPADTDQATFINTQMAPGAFTDAWVFDFDPGGQVSINAAFNPLSAIGDFTVSLYVDTGSVCAAGKPGACSSISHGAVAIATATNDGFADLDFTALEAGRYVFVITGILTGPGSYAGNMNTYVTLKEGGTWVLLLGGLIILGVLGALWFVLQRRKV